MVDPPGDNILTWYGRVQQQFGIRPYVRIGQPDMNLSQIALQSGEREIFFFVNSYAEREIETDAEFSTGNKTPWQWDPETGERRPYYFSQSRNRLNLRIEPCGSLLLVFEPGMNRPAVRPSRAVEADAIRLPAPWQVELRHVDGTRSERTLNEPIDFKDDESLRAFAGTAVYRGAFTAPSAAYAFLDLGPVNGISSVTLNGKTLGVKWYGCHRYAIGATLKNGENRLEIQITTVLGNYCKSLESNAVTKKWVGRQPWQSAGLRGPVRLLKEA